MVWQVIGVMLTLAGGFEWAFAPGLGKLAGVTDKTAEHILSVTHAGADVAADVGKEMAGKPGEQPGTPAIPGAQTLAGAAGGDPLAFMTSNSAALEQQRQKILAAFIQRSSATRDYSDDDWLDITKFNLTVQEQIYQQLYVDLQGAASDADKLKSDKDIAFVLERHLWASWISGQAEELAKDYKEMQEAYAMAPMGGMSYMPDEKDYEQGYSLGGDIEDRLNEVGFVPDGVTLTGSWYSSNSPDNWRELLLNFARGYNEGITR